MSYQFSIRDTVTYNTGHVTLFSNNNIIALHFLPPTITIEYNVNYRL